MGPVVGRVLVALFALAAAAWLPARAQSDAGVRLALVIGNGAYREAPLPTAANDAGLVAQTLAAAGFDVTGARDLGGDDLRAAFRDFLGKAGASGPDGIAVVYLAGRAVQVDGENYFVPVDAKIAHEADVPIETLRLADFNRALAALPIRAKVVLIDGAYADAAAPGPLAAGLALMEAEQGELLAFNAAPGTAAPIPSQSYGIYAQTLTQFMKQGGVPVEEIFDRVRMAVNEATRGAVVPWDSAKLTRSFLFFERSPDAPLVDSAQIPFAALRSRPLRTFPADQAYDVAIARDSLDGYQEFVATFPTDPQVRRVRVLLALRREAFFWRDAVRRGAPAAFWTYLTRYPRGPHAAEARRRLARAAAADAPPPNFAPLAFDVPPPPETEYVIFEQPILLEDPDVPPPPPPLFLLPPMERFVPPPPVAALAPMLLPIPMPLPIAHVRALAEPGQILPFRGASRGYLQPRPYTAGAGGNGLAVQAQPPQAPEPPPGPPPGGRPAGPVPPPGVVAFPTGNPPRPERNPPGLPAPVAVPIVPGPPGAAGLPVPPGKVVKPPAGVSLPPGIPPRPERNPIPLPAPVAAPIVPRSPGTPGIHVPPTKVVRPPVFVPSPGALPVGGSNQPGRAPPFGRPASRLPPPGDVPTKLRVPGSPPFPGRPSRSPVVPPRPPFTPSGPGSDTRFPVFRPPGRPPVGAPSRFDTPPRGPGGTSMQAQPFRPAAGGPSRFDAPPRGSGGPFMQGQPFRPAAGGPSRFDAPPRSPGMGFPVMHAQPGLPFRPADGPRPGGGRGPGPGRPPGPGFQQGGGRHGCENPGQPCR